MTSRKSKKPAVARSPSSAPVAPTKPARWKWLIFGAVLIAATLIAYRPAWHGGFVWDDDAHITRVELRSAEGLRRIWFEVGATQQYYPVVHSSFWLMHRAWGDR